MLTEHLYGARPWSDTEDIYGESISEGGPEGLWCYIYGVAEADWNQFFQYVDEEIDRKKFRNGESVLLYIPYNEETGVELGGRGLTQK